MKNNKKGFSLAEVLIALTIAAIVAIFGFSIAKKGIAKAYDRYIYAGYYAISIALSDAADTRGLSMQDAGCSGSLSDTNSCSFSDRIVKALNGRNVGGSRNTIEFDTPNGIRYNIQRLRIYPYPAYDPSIERADSASLYKIKMRVPAAKQRNTTHKTICMLYVENFLWNANSVEKNYENFLMPYQCTESDRYTEDNGDLIDIQNSKHLLPFYLDDGKRGQMTLRPHPNPNPSDAEMEAFKLDSNNYEYNKRIFRTAKEAYCLKASSHERAGEIDGKAILELNNRLICTPGDLPRIENNSNSPNYNGWEGDTSSIIRVTDPRRI